MCSQCTNRSELTYELTQLLDAFTGWVHRCHDLISCSETSTTGARSFRSLESMHTELLFSSCAVNRALTVSSEHAPVTCTLGMNQKQYEPYSRQITTSTPTDNHANRDVNETRESRVSIFFLDPGKGISRFPRIDTDVTARQ